MTKKQASTNSRTPFGEHFFRHAFAVVLIALTVSVIANRITATQYRTSERELVLVAEQLAQQDRQFDETLQDVEALFTELVGNLEHKYIPLDRSTRISLRRGQAICNRLASGTQDPIRKASAYGTLGHIHFHLHDLKASATAYRRVIAELSSEKNDFEHLLVSAYASNHLVQALATLGCNDEALEHCRHIRSYVDLLPNRVELQNELAFALRNEAILLAESDRSAAIELAKAHLRLLEQLSSDEQTDLGLSERRIDGMYLLAGLFWDSNETRHSALTLLEQVHHKSAELAEVAAKRLRTGESAYDYSRYKAETRRSKREANFATTTLSPDSDEIRHPSFWSRKNLYRGRRSASTEILIDDLRMPGEFENQEAMILIWSGREWQDSTQLTLIGELVTNVSVIMLVRDFENEEEAKEALAREGIPTNNIRFFHLPANTLWIRDFGPLTVESSDGFPIWIDYQHQSPDHRSQNDLLTERLGGLTGHRVIRGPLSLEGGNLIGNGAGITVCTNLLEEDNLQLGFTSKQFRRRLHSMIGCTELVVLEKLQRERTGHVDWFVSFVSPTTVVVGQYPTAVDPENSLILDRNAELLSAVQTRNGPLKVVRIPMPSHPPNGFGGTYTNVVFANGKLIVPTWENAGNELNQQALNIYRKLLPDWEVVGIDCTKMLPDAGAIHCATINIPKMPANKSSIPD